MQENKSVLLRGGISVDAPKIPSSSKRLKKQQR